MKYYGLVDTENLSYGFVEENDERITDKFIKITDEYHQQLLDEASEGLEIVSDNKTVFTAKRKLYFVNEQGLWERKTDEECEAEQAKEREKAFKTTFFEIPPIDGIFKGGYYRKQPKGYQSAVESINTAFNAVNVLGLLPQDYLIFYTKPDFTDETQCTEEWLVANQFRNQTMTAQEFGQFYIAFMTGWNNREHKTDLLA